MSRRLAQLNALAILVRDAEMAKLKRLQVQRAKAEAEQAALRSREQAVQAGAGPDAVHLSGAVERWFDWTAQRHRILAAEAANVAAQAEAQMLRTRRAAGRADVLERLARQGDGPFSRD